VAEDGQFSSSQTGLLPNVSILLTPLVIAEVPPPIAIAAIWDLGLSFLLPTLNQSDWGYGKISHRLLINVL
jgi:hypothetical protein